MTDEKRYTETEVRRREREAFVAGTQWRFMRAGGGLLGRNEAQDEAKRRFPITKRVGREIRLAGGVRVRSENGFLLFRHPDDASVPVSLEQIGSASVPALRELLENPYTEEAE